MSGASTRMRTQGGASPKGRTAALIGLVVLLFGLFAVASPGQAAPGGPGERIDVFIGFDRTPGPAEQALVRRAGGDIQYSYTIVPAIAASVPVASVDALARNPRVQYIEPVIEITLLDEPDYEAELANTWGVEHIGGGDAHEAGYTGNGVRVAVLDTGIDGNHPDLAANFDPDCSWAPDADGYTIDDGHGHGTHVAGTIGAVRDGSGVVGVAPEVTLCAYAVLSNSGGGSYSYVIAALEEIQAFNQDNPESPILVTNNSYGSSGDPGSTVRAAFDNLYADGVLHVGAAGNEGNPPGRGSNCIYPALYDTVMAVAATNSNDGRASFSSTCNELELSAPGVSINSTWIGGGYREASGTSMASPHVAGTAALVFANSTLSNDGVRQVLHDEAKPLGSNRLYGSGLVQAYASVLAVADAEPAPTGTITGKVTDDDGAAIEGATVTVGDTGLSATTDGGGNYTIEDVPEGTHDVTASAEDHVSQTKQVSVDEGETKTVNFSLEPVAEPATGTIGGTVTAGTGDGIGGATVEAVGTSDEGTFTTTTADDGTYYLDSLPVGTYDVTASASGYDSQTKQAEVTDGQTTTVDFALQPSSTDDTVTVYSIDYSTRGGRLNDRHLDVTITVTDGDGNPVAGATVEVDLKLEGERYGSTSGTTGSNGTMSFTANNAPDGCYTTVVTDLSADDLEWDGSTPENSFAKGTNGECS